MTERKCSNCRQPGHTKATCLQAHDIVCEMDAPFPDAPMSDYRDSDESVTVTGPVETITKGPWHGAHRDGRCTWCGDRYAEGDRIRSDGQGGWECESGLEDDHSMDAPASWQRPTAANVKLPAPLIGRNIGPVSDPSLSLGATSEADDFLSGPTPMSEADAFLMGDAQEGEEPKKIEKYTKNGRYRITDPTTGDFRRYKNGNVLGIVRATTFNKAASDSFAITQWNKRNVLLGAARRPDIAAKAHGMDVTEDRTQLDAWVEVLEDAAGGNVASGMGTDVHAWTEKIDAETHTLEDVPPAYRHSVELYVDTLRRAGLRVVPELMEQTVFIEEFGGVAGSFDRIFYHSPSDTYVLGDLKTGKNVGKYGWSEIETQEWIYAYGYNRFGTYNWESEEWERPTVHVRMDYGVVIKLPLVGPDAGTCTLLRTDLDNGAEHAKLCHAVRTGGKGKAEAFFLPQPSWDERFSRVTTNQQAADLWKQAKAEGVELLELNRLVGIAQRALSTVDTGRTGS